MNLFFNHDSGRSGLPENPNKGIDYEKGNLKTIWLAGGCFWGVEAYFARIPGVAETRVGYANGRTAAPRYEEIKATGHAETVEISYDPEKVSLETLLDYFFKIIDPTLENRQGNDVGTQYRSGIYCRDEAELSVIRTAVDKHQKDFDRPIVTEILPLRNFCPAEEYHQNYLEKNPGGYCHVNFSSLPFLTSPPDLPPASAAPEKQPFSKPDNGVLRESLTPAQYYVTREGGTEPPFANPYWNNHARGIYVDVATGEPLFVSSDKFDSGCGWPSFSKPIDRRLIAEKIDRSHGMIRTEVRSRLGDSHLGHVFSDGPKELGGLRYCINSAALRFIPAEEMEAEGYGDWLNLVK